MSNRDEKTVSDAELLRDCSDLNSQAAKMLYDRYRSLVFSICLKLTGDHEVAQECFNDTWMRVWKQCHTVDVPESGSIGGWIATIARFVCLSGRRDHWKQMERYITGKDLLEEAGSEPAAAEMPGLVDGRLHELPPLVQASYLLTRSCGIRRGGVGTHTGKEVATLLDLAGPPAVTRLVAQARKHLEQGPEQEPAR